MNQDKDLTAIISLIRHGEKDGSGELTLTGQKQSREKGIKTPYLGGDIILFHSGSDRVKKTIRLAASYLRLNETDVEEIIEDTNLQDYETRLLHYLKNSKEQGEFFANWDKIEDSASARKERMESFLALGDKSTEPEVYYSPIEMARNVAKLVETQIDFALITTPESRTNFINGSHEPVIMSFIAYALSGFKRSKNPNLSEIGDSVDYTEGVDILVRQTVQDYKLQMQFRDMKIDLDLEEIRRFIS